MDRRRFLTGSGLALGAITLAPPALARQTQHRSADAAPADLSDWGALRSQFDLDPDLIHMSMFFLASHPRPVREAIERHRRAFDRNPVAYRHDGHEQESSAVPAAAASYLGVRPEDIALTDSTTMGLAILYGTIRLRPDQEILTTTHDHYSTRRSLELRAERTGARVRTVPLYTHGGRATESEIVSSLAGAISPSTRVVAVTWVHSCTGVKLPLRVMADVIGEANGGRAEDDRIVFCVDGVHGLGIEDVTLPELGCDFFVAGTHKWMFGPRGTGVLWGGPQVQDLLSPLIPPFAFGHDGSGPTWGMLMSPGGFHSFEHRWALDEAFRFHQRIGKARVAARIHALNRQLKEGMAQMRHIRLHTPISDALSSGIVCFEADGLEPREIVDRLAAKKIVASVSPYEVAYARLAPSLLNDEAEVEECLSALRELA